MDGVARPGADQGPVPFGEVARRTGPTRRYRVVRRPVRFGYGGNTGNRVKVSASVLAGSRYDRKFGLERAGADHERPA